MNESEFLTIGKQLLDRMEAAIDECDLDLDIERKSDGVVDLEFENGTHIVVNLQAPMRQVWLAAKAKVKRLALFHHDPAHDDDELDEILAPVIECAAKLGVDAFAARERTTVTI